LNGPTRDELVERARRWAADDPDPDMRDEALALVDGGDEARLRDQFGSVLHFGTAGLRGAMGAGPARMNRVTVRRAAAGLASWLGKGKRVVIGRDARHRSLEFAEDSARVIAAADSEAMVLPEPLPTPLLSFAIRHLGADAGVMVTASHNPAGDNGYKVYLADGAQIVPPVDDEIATAIERVAVRPIPLAEPDDSRIHRLDDDVRGAYVGFASGVVAPGPRDLTIVYTPMHGVGGRVAREVFERVGFDRVHVVRQQGDPDPDFPTVAFPNPEEPGALDLALALAREVDADLVIANDPDADRLGIAVPDDDGWRQLTGNEVGALLGEHVLAQTEGADRLVVTTIVSDDLLGALAAAAGVRSIRTLTGFKWVVRPALVDPSLRFVFGYEESLGYSVAEYVRDKDGITAAVAFADVAARLAGSGGSVVDRLDSLARAHGLHASRTWSVRREGPDGPREIADAMGRLRSSSPKELVGRPVTSIVDYLERADPAPADVVELVLEGERVIVRPSGTEPKLKLYFHTVVPVDADADDLHAARSEAETRISALQDAMGELLAFS
jgi:phosphomannomutase